MKNQQKNAKGTITVQLERTFDPKRRSNSLHFKFEDTSVRVSEGDKEIGSVCGLLGGGIEFSDEATKEQWVIKAQDLWRAFAEFRSTFTEQKKG